MGTGTRGQTQYDFFYGIIYKKDSLKPMNHYAKVGRETVDEDMLMYRAESLGEDDKEKIQELIDAPSGWIYINNGHGIIVKVENGYTQGFTDERRNAN